MKDRLRRLVRRSSVASCLALCASVILTAGAPSASAASLAGFDDPLLGTSAAAQATRLPSPPDVPGLFAQNMGDYGVTYTVAGPSATGVLVDRKAFVAKVGRSYSASYGAANVTILALKPGSRLADEVNAAARHDGVAASTARTSRTSDGWQVWSYPNTKVGADYNRAAYAAKGNQIVRVFCQWNDGPDTPTDTVLGCVDPAKVAIQVARTKPAPPSESGLSSLLPSSTPSGLRPSFAAITTSELIWSTRNGATEAITADMGARTVDLYWTIPAAPGLVATVSATTLASMRATPAFLADLCPKGASTCTSRPDLAKAPAGGAAVAVAYHPEGEKGTWALETQVVGDGRLLDIGCAVAGADVRALSPAEISTCSSVLPAISRAMLTR